MKRDYVYPELGDRQSVADWLDSGAESIWQRAQGRVQDLLAEPPPGHLSASAENKIRAAFDIRLTQENSHESKT